MSSAADDQFELELKMGFLEESAQLVAEAEQCYLVLETNPKDTATLEKIFRIAHNIKGSSKAVGFDSLGVFTHEFESFLLKAKNGQIPILPATISLLLKCNDQIRSFIERLKEEPSAEMKSDALIQELHDFEKNLSAPSAQASSESLQESDGFETEIVPETFTEPSNETLSSADSGVEESSSMSDLSPAETASDPSGPAHVASVPSGKTLEPIVTGGERAASTSTPGSGATSAGPPASEESIRVSLGRLEKLLNFVGELVIFQTVLREQAYRDNPQVLRKTIHQMGKVTKEVQDLSMSLRMVPLKQTFQKMQRIVRDTSSVLGKKVQLQLQGEETEVDKTVLEALGDPLVHLVRNAVDHGVEMPEERAQKGKSETGVITLKAYHASGKLVIEVKDDGGGISPDRVRAKALEKGILKPGQTLSDQDAIQLIFHPGFSTKAQVTEVSGRGVGMDVVKINIEQMQGEVLVETVQEKGSTFKIILPLTFAIIDGMVVRSGDDRYVIPLAHVHESVKPEPKDLKFATGVGEVLLLRGENLPVVRLSQALGKRKGPKVTYHEQIAIIIRTSSRPFAVLVDDVIGQHQVVIKKLGSEMQDIRGYSGSAILGDGKPALILELGDLVSQGIPGSQLSPARSSPRRQVAA